ncbi:hypothetical protein DLAC_01971 [Tieghemostelium lacteum]|uniref:Uncharacterized protein n=1 Tax=Tieghemostelium lacteum TaxID=361077 RepID=A0A152A584_TIELA|nr:hypothetical protein DLAC_01971 [Tieghemostelium lacteum]|eukprot:KYR01384.1 hypothetical protein DLAC_01971 [Tieghemostelium lacteum]
MNEQLFFGVWRNKYLIKLIFSNVVSSDIDIQNRYREYREIFNVDWILAQNYIDLLRDKVETNQYLIFTKEAWGLVFDKIKEKKLLEKIYKNYGHLSESIHLLEMAILNGNLEALSILKPLIVPQRFKYLQKKILESGHVSVLEYLQPHIIPFQSVSFLTCAWKSENRNEMLSYLFKKSLINRDVKMGIGKPSPIPPLYVVNLDPDHLEWLSGQGLLLLTKSDLGDILTKVHLVSIFSLPLDQIRIMCKRMAWITKKTDLIPEIETMDNLNLLDLYLYEFILLMGMSSHTQNIQAVFTLFLLLNFSKRVSGCQSSFNDWTDYHIYAPKHHQDLLYIYENSEKFQRSKEDIINAFRNNFSLYSISELVKQIYISNRDSNVKIELIDVFLSCIPPDSPILNYLLSDIIQVLDVGLIKRLVSKYEYLINKSLSLQRALRESFYDFEIFQYFASFHTISDLKVISINDIVNGVNLDVLRYFHQVVGSGYSQPLKFKSKNNFKKDVEVLRYYIDNFYMESKQMFISNDIFIEYPSLIEYIVNNNLLYRFGLDNEKVFLNFLKQGFNLRIRSYWSNINAILYLHRNSKALLSESNWNSIGAIGSYKILQEALDRYKLNWNISQSLARGILISQDLNMLKHCSKFLIPNLSLLSLDLSLESLANEQNIMILEYIFSKLNAKKDTKKLELLNSKSLESLLFKGNIQTIIFLYNYFNLKFDSNLHRESSKKNKIF